MSDVDKFKTSRRLPRSPHAEIERAATAVGVTINADTILRLRDDPRHNHAEAIIQEIRRRNESIAEVLSRQMTVMWTGA